MCSLMHMAYNEKELIKQSQNGDNQAFGLLYDNYIRTIYNFIYYKTFHKETAEDLTSQTFLKVLKNINSVDPEKSFRSWLYKVAQNTVLDHYRTQRMTSDIDDLWDLSDDTDIVLEVDDADSVRTLKKHLNTLPQSDRDIILMRVWQELSYKEIAEIVGKTEASCKMSYSRSIKKLRALLPLVLFLLMLSHI
jgi:RNA polymerase sigma factor (sigma-70 family)